MKPMFIVDCEAEWGCPSPIIAPATEIGVVRFDAPPFGNWFHWKRGEPIERLHEWVRAQAPDGAQFISDNPAFDWQWVAAEFARKGLPNPFGFSARRIGDYAAGLKANWRDANSWKRLRKTDHTHNPVDDARGNAEALWALGVRP